MYPYHIDTCITRSEVDVKNNLRLLWEQHGTWTRLAIVSLAFDLPDTKFVLERLLQNATDMGNFFKPYYGEEIGNAYGNLIREHLVIAADLVKAAKAGDHKKAAELERKWYANADEISVFLNRINLFIDVNKMRKMMHEHLALVKSEAVYMLQKDYRSGVAVYDIKEAQALHMADTIADAMVQQFYFRF